MNIEDITLVEEEWLSDLSYKLQTVSEYMRGLWERMTNVKVDEPIPDANLVTKSVYGAYLITRDMSDKIYDKCYGYTSIDKSDVKKHLMNIVDDKGKGDI